MSGVNGNGNQQQASKLLHQTSEDCLPVEAGAPSKACLGHSEPTHAQPAIRSKLAGGQSARGSDSGLEIPKQKLMISTVAQASGLCYANPKHDGND